jgi:hypothetical protein
MALERPYDLQGIEAFQGAGWLILEAVYPLPSRSMPGYEFLLIQ